MIPEDEVTLIATEGYGLEAEVSCRGRRFRVMDDFSEVDLTVAPGPLGAVEFTAEDFGGLE